MSQLTAEQSGLGELTVAVGTAAHQVRAAHDAVGHGPGGLATVLGPIAGSFVAAFERAHAEFADHLGQLAATTAGIHQSVPATFRTYAGHDTGTAHALHAESSASGAWQA